ncbi:MAG: hypothetical protein O9256_00770 [Rhizobiaceae bacterium]|nr:hypothetical protein [Rhizobiaceae bacterium]
MTIRRSLAVLALVFSGMVAGQQQRIPGEIWRVLDEGTKMAFVQGFIMGHQAGAKRQQTAEVRAECGELTEDLHVEKAIAITDCILKDRPTRSHMRASDAKLLVEGLNSIYSDVANSRIEFEFALSLMQSRLLGEVDDAFYQTILENARAVAAEQN